jgi:flagellin FlaB
MNLIRKGHRNTHRGVIGIESAIVLIAFVIVAAALAFVVLNMCFATSQKAKTSITSALGEAGSSLSIYGKVVGTAPIAGGSLNAIMVPLKLTSGGENVDLDNTRATISYLGQTIEYDNIYDTTCTLTAVIYANATFAWAAAPAACINVSPITAAPTNTAAIVYWAVANQVPPNSILEPGEHAVLSIGWSQVPDERPTDLDKIKVELAVSGGATLTVERTVPNISSTIVDLG